MDQSKQVLNIKYSHEGQSELTIEYQRNATSKVHSVTYSLTRDSNGRIVGYSTKDGSSASGHFEVHYNKQGISIHASRVVSNKSGGSPIRLGHDGRITIHGANHVGDRVAEICVESTNRVSITGTNSFSHLTLDTPYADINGSTQVASLASNVRSMRTVGELTVHENLTCKVHDWQNVGILNTSEEACVNIEANAMTNIGDIVRRSEKKSQKKFQVLTQKFTNQGNIDVNNLNLIVEGGHDTGPQNDFINAGVITGDDRVRVQLARGARGLNAGKITSRGELVLECLGTFINKHIVEARKHIKVIFNRIVNEGVMLSCDMHLCGISVRGGERAEFCNKSLLQANRMMKIDGDGDFLEDSTGILLAGSLKSKLDGDIDCEGRVATKEADLNADNLSFTKAEDDLCTQSMMERVKGIFNLCRIHDEQRLSRKEFKFGVARKQVLRRKRNEHEVARRVNAYLKASHIQELMVKDGGDDALACRPGLRVAGEKGAKLQAKSEVFIGKKAVIDVENELDVEKVRDFLVDGEVASKICKVDDGYGTMIVGREGNVVVQKLDLKLNAIENHGLLLTSNGIAELFREFKSAVEKEFMSGDEVCKRLESLFNREISSDHISWDEYKESWCAFTKAMGEENVTHEALLKYLAKTLNKIATSQVDSESISCHVNMANMTGVIATAGDMVTACHQEEHAGDWIEQGGLTVARSLTHNRKSGSFFQTLQANVLTSRDIAIHAADIHQAGKMFMASKESNVELDGLDVEIHGKIASMGNILVNAISRVEQSSESNILAEGDCKISTEQLLTIAGYVYADTVKLATNMSNGELIISGNVCGQKSFHGEGSSARVEGDIRTTKDNVEFKVNDFTALDEATCRAASKFILSAIHAHMSSKVYASDAEINANELKIERGSELNVVNKVTFDVISLFKMAGNVLAKSCEIEGNSLTEILEDAKITIEEKMTITAKALNNSGGVSAKVLSATLLETVRQHKDGFISTKELTEIVSELGILNKGYIGSDIITDLKSTKGDIKNEGKDSVIIGSDKSKLHAGSGITNDGFIGGDKVELENELNEIVFNEGSVCAANRVFEVNAENFINKGLLETRGGIKTLHDFFDKAINRLDAESASPQEYANLSKAFVMFFIKLRKKNSVALSGIDKEQLREIRELIKRADITEDRKLRSLLDILSKCIDESKDKSKINIKASRYDALGAVFGDVDVMVESKKGEENPDINLGGLAVVNKVNYSAENFTQTSNDEQIAGDSFDVTCKDLKQNGKVSATNSVSFGASTYTQGKKGHVNTDVIETKVETSCDLQGKSIASEITTRSDGTLTTADDSQFARKKLSMTSERAPELGRTVIPGQIEVKVKSETGKLLLNNDMKSTEQGIDLDAPAVENKSSIISKLLCRIKTRRTDLDFSIDNHGSIASKDGDIILEGQGYKNRESAKLLAHNQLSIKVKVLHAAGKIGTEVGKLVAKISEQFTYVKNFLGAVSAEFKLPDGFTVDEGNPLVNTVGDLILTISDSASKPLLVLSKLAAKGKLEISAKNIDVVVGRVGKLAEIGASKDSSITARNFDCKWAQVVFGEDLRMSITKNWFIGDRKKKTERECVFKSEDYFKDRTYEKFEGNKSYFVVKGDCGIEAMENVIGDHADIIIGGGFSTNKVKEGDESKVLKLFKLVSTKMRIFGDSTVHAKTWRLLREYEVLPEESHRNGLFLDKYSAQYMKSDHENSFFVKGKLDEWSKDYLNVGSIHYSDEDSTCKFEKREFDEDCCTRLLRVRDRIIPAYTIVERKFFGFRKKKIHMSERIVFHAKDRLVYVPADSGEGARGTATLEGEELHNNGRFHANNVSASLGTLKNGKNDNAIDTTREKPNPVQEIKIDTSSSGMLERDDTSIDAIVSNKVFNRLSEPRYQEFPIYNLKTKKMQFGRRKDQVPMYSQDIVAEEVQKKTFKVQGKGSISTETDYDSAPIKLRRNGIEALLFGHHKLDDEEETAQHALLREINKNPDKIEDIVRSRIEKRRRITKSSNDKNLSWSPLHEVIYAMPYKTDEERNIKNKVLNIFFEVGCNVNAKDVFGYTPLHYAAAFGDLDSVKKLLSNNAFENGDEGKAIISSTSRDQNLSPLHIAVIKSQYEVVKELLSIDTIDINRKEFKYGMTPFHFALLTQDEGIIDLFLSRFGDSYKPVKNALGLDDKDMVGIRSYSYGDYIKLHDMTRLIVQSLERHTVGYLDYLEKEGAEDDDKLPFEEISSDEIKKYTPDVASDKIPDSILLTTKADATSKVDGTLVRRERKHKEKEQSVSFTVKTEHITHEEMMPGIEKEKHRVLEQCNYCNTQAWRFENAAKQYLKDGKITYAERAYIAALSTLKEMHGELDKKLDETVEYYFPDHYERYSKSKDKTCDADDFFGVGDLPGIIDDIKKFFHKDAESILNGEKDISDMQPINEKCALADLQFYEHLMGDISSLIREIGSKAESLFKMDRSSDQAHAKETRLLKKLENGLETPTVIEKKSYAESEGSKRKYDAECDLSGYAYRIEEPILIDIEKDSDDPSIGHSYLYPVVIYPAKFIDDELSQVRGALGGNYVVVNAKDGFNYGKLYALKDGVLNIENFVNEQTTHRRVYRLFDVIKNRKLLNESVEVREKWLEEVRAHAGGIISGFSKIQGKWFNKIGGTIRNTKGIVVSFTHGIKMRAVEEKSIQRSSSKARTFAGSSSVTTNSEISNFVDGGIVSDDFVVFNTGGDIDMEGVSIVAKTMIALLADGEVIMNPAKTDVYLGGKAVKGKGSVATHEMWTQIAKSTSLATEGKIAIIGKKGVEGVATQMAALQIDVEGSHVRFDVDVIEDKHKTSSVGSMGFTYFSEKSSGTDERVRRPIFLCNKINVRATNGDAVIISPQIIGGDESVFNLKSDNGRARILSAEEKHESKTQRTSIGLSVTGLDAALAFASGDLTGSARSLANEVPILSALDRLASTKSSDQMMGNFMRLGYGVNHLHESGALKDAASMKQHLLKHFGFDKEGNWDVRNLSFSVRFGKDKEEKSWSNVISGVIEMGKVFIESAGDIDLEAVEIDCDEFDLDSGENINMLAKEAHSHYSRKSRGFTLSSQGNNVNVGIDGSGQHRDATTYSGTNIRARKRATMKAKNGILMRGATLQTAQVLVEAASLRIETLQNKLRMRGWHGSASTAGSLSFGASRQDMAYADHQAGITADCMRIKVDNIHLKGGELEMRGSKKPFIARVDNQTVKLYRYESPNDNDTFFHALGKSRMTIVTDLVSKKDDESIRNSMASFIEQILLDGKLPANVARSKDGNKIASEYLKAKMALDRFIKRHKLPKQYGEMTLNGNLQDLNGVTIRRHLRKDYNKRLRVFMSKNDRLVSYVTNPDVFETFVTYFLSAAKNTIPGFSDKTDAHHGLLDAVAQLYNLQITVFCNLGSESLTKCYSTGHAKHKINIQIDDDGRFHFLHKKPGQIVTRSLTYEDVMNYDRASSYDVSVGGLGGDTTTLGGGASNRVREGVTRGHVSIDASVENPEGEIIGFSGNRDSSTKNVETRNSSSGFSLYVESDNTKEEKLTGDNKEETSDANESGDEENEEQDKAKEKGSEEKESTVGSRENNSYEQEEEEEEEEYDEKDHWSDEDTDEFFMSKTCDGMAPREIVGDAIGLLKDYVDVDQAKITDFSLAFIAKKEQGLSDKDAAKQALIDVGVDTLVVDKIPHRKLANLSKYPIALAFGSCRDVKSKHHKYIRKRNKNLKKYLELRRELRNSSEPDPELEAQAQTYREAAFEGASLWNSVGNLLWELRAAVIEPIDLAADALLRQPLYDLSDTVDRNISDAATSVRNNTSTFFRNVRRPFQTTPPTLEELESRASELEERTARSWNEYHREMAPTYQDLREGRINDSDFGTIFRGRSAHIRRMEGELTSLNNRISSMRSSDEGPSSASPRPSSD